MRWSRIVVGGVLVLAAVSTTGPACGAGESIANRLEEILGGTGGRGGHQASADEIREALEHQLRAVPGSAPGSDKPSSAAFPTRQTLLDFYARREQHLVWTSETGAVMPIAETLLEALERAGDQGLDPNAYAVGPLQRLRKNLRAGRGEGGRVARRADFDLLLTTAFFRYASDLSTGRVHPEEVRSEWLTEPPDLDLPATLDKALAEGRFEKLVERLAPPHPGYERLRAALVDLRKVEKAGGWKTIPAGPALKQGSRGQRVALLRERLGVRGGLLRPSAKRSSGGAVFDAATLKAVEEFQTRHGIEPDGIVGRGTLAALNVPVALRIRQVELNLERWRWLPRRLGDVHVEVNIPGFEMTLVRDGQPDLRSRIVAGSAFTPTPVFTDRIVAVVANPAWNVPHALAVREYLPELKHDPKLFERRGIRIFKDRGKNGTRKNDEEAEAIDPTKVAWKRVDADEFDYRLRQDPGPENALGRMKFQLTNDFQIYLHDTPARAAFDETSRDLSHGCIRVEAARALADRLLGDDAPRLEEALASSDEKVIPVRPPVPIQILYLTAWVDDDGALRFGPDVYEFDAAQEAALERIVRPAAPRL